MRVTLRNTLLNSVSDEIVIEHFMQFVFCRRRSGKWYVQLHIEQDTLLTQLFEVMDTDVAHHLKVAQKQSAAIGKGGVHQEGIHVEGWV
jgi:hypothetical protein